ncbi:MAG: response regulator [Deltaproteobacteria bacterium]|nr:response regulator [Deltaproteobacteria bacterium]
MRILVVEDDRGTAGFIKKGFGEQGFAVDTAFDGEEGLHLAGSNSYDVLILDVMLPGLSGFQLLKDLRKQAIITPAIFLTAKDEKRDVVHGLELGADDYLVKPFEFSELLARVRAVLRRGPQEQPSACLAVDNLTLDLLTRTAQRGDRMIDLTGKEFHLLEYLMKNSGQVLTRTMIIEKVWGYSFDTASNIIEVHINRLRAKVDRGFSPKLIHTIKGVGYVLKDV